MTLGDKQNHERVDHIKEMSTATIKHEVKDIEMMLTVFDRILSNPARSLMFSIPQLDAVVHLKHQFLNAKKDMVF